jgi:transcription initiation factor TFIIB
VIIKEMSKDDPIPLVTDPNTGELIRKDTGEVISGNNESSFEKEWRAVGLERNQSGTHTQVPTSLAYADMGLSTVIGKGRKDASGNQIDPATQMRMGRLRMWDSRSRSHPAKERSLQQAFTLLSKIKARLSLPDYVTEKAAYLYRKAQQNGLIRGDSINSVMAASVYAATRQSGVLRTFDEISESMDVKPKQASRSYRKIVSQLDIKVPIVDHNRYITSIGNKLGFDERTKRRALEILDQAQEKDIVAGKDPVSIAASILYLANLIEGEKSYRTQADIARAAGITEVTIRNRLKELRKRLSSAVDLSEVTSARSKIPKIKSIHHNTPNWWLLTN